MNKIKIRNISKEILKNEHLETTDDLRYLIAESSSTRGLAFFDIKYDDTRDILEIPDMFDVDEAIDVVTVYLAWVEEDTDALEFEGRPYEYYNEIKPYKGADDGTFDSAGTFVISILSIIKQVLAETPYSFKIRKRNIGIFAYQHS